VRQKAERDVGRGERKVWGEAKKESWGGVVGRRGRGKIKRERLGRSRWGDWM